MARDLGRLSAVALPKIKSPGLHPDGGGLYLQVTKGGARTWVYRYMLHGRAREMGLGPLHIVSLAEAREKARGARRLRHEGIDPIEARKAKQAEERLAAATTMPFRECAERYIEAQKAGWKNAKHAKQWSSTLETYAYPALGSLPVQAVDVGLVMKVLEPIWQTKPETASRVRGRIESVLDWATVRGYRKGENPARWRGHLDKLLPAPSKAKRAKRQATGRGEHHSALPFSEIPEFMKELRAHEGISALALRFTILTAKRTKEVIGSLRKEIDRRARMWTIPAGRMKGEREHRLPLSAAGLAVLDQMATLCGNDDPEDFLFPGARPGRPLSNMAMLKLLQKGMGRPNVTVHGFRSTFSDWCSEITTFPAEVREMALAHVVDDKVEAAYRRGDLLDKRRELMEAWARYCETKPGENVLAVVRGEARELEAAG